MASEPDTTAEGLIYEHIKEAPQQQMEKANWLDDKIIRIFAAASVVIGLLGLSSSTTLAPGLSRETIFLLLLPLAPYLFAAYMTFTHITPMRFHWGLQADELPRYWNTEEGDVRRALINEAGKSYKLNKAILAKKAWCIRAVLLAVSAEVA
jgi:hypothetical protein